MALQPGMKGSVMNSVAPRPGSVKGSLAAYRPEPAPAVPFPTWHALCAEMLSRHREMGLSYGECCLFAVLVHYSSPDDSGARFSHATNATLAEKMGCEERDVRRFLKALEGAGFIERFKRVGRGRGRELERSRESIMIAWRPGSDRMSPLSYPWADHSAEAVAAAEALVRDGVRRAVAGQSAPTVNFDRPEHQARSTSTMGMVNPDRGCKDESDLALGQVRPTYEIPPETPKEESPLRAPSSPSSPASAGPNPKTPPAGMIAAGGREGDDEGGGGGDDLRDAHEARVADLAVQNARRDGRDVVGEADVARAREILDAPAIRPHLEGRDAADALRAMAAEARREQRRPAEKITPEQNAAGIEWLGRWRKWRDGGKAGPIPAWTSSEPMLPGVRLKFDEHARAGGAAG